MAGLAQGVAEPFETFVQTVAGGGAGGLDVLLGERISEASSGWRKVQDIPRHAASNYASPACR